METTRYRYIDVLWLLAWLIGRVLRVAAWVIGRVLRVVVLLPITLIAIIAHDAQDDYD